MRRRRFRHMTQRNIAKYEAAIRRYFKTVQPRMKDFVLAEIHCATNI